MVFRISGCGLGTDYAYTREEAEKFAETQNLCSKYEATITEFTPRYWAVQTQKDGYGDEHWIGLVDESGKDWIINQADKKYRSLTREERKKYDVSVFLVHDDFLKEDEYGGVNMDCWETIYSNGVDYTKPYVLDHAVIKQNGNSLVVVITDAADKLDLMRGDECIVTVQKKLRE